MTVGDLRLLLDGVDDNKVVVFRDSNGWCNLQNCVDSYSGYIVLLEDIDNLFDD